MSTTVTYKGNTLTTATNQTRTLKTQGKYMEGDVIITDVSSSGAAIVVTDTEDVHGGTIREITAVSLEGITVNSSVLLRGYTAIDSSGNLVNGAYNGGGGTITLQTKSVTPTETAQVITADTGYDGLEEVDVAAISSSYVGSGIPRKDSSDVTISTNTGLINVPAGYYANDYGVQLSTVSGSTITPTESEQTAVAANKYTLGAIKVGAISSTYVGSGITQRDSDDLTSSAATVSVPAGYYAEAASKSVTIGSTTGPSSLSGSSATITTGTNTITLTKTGVTTTPTVNAGYVSSATASTATVTLTASVTTKGAATITPSTSQQTIPSGTYLTGTQTISAMPTGTAGTPTATKGNVSNHQVTVTPSVTNTTGYITGGTKNGTGVTVSANELVSGSQNITENGTVDVTNLAEVIVNVEGSSSGLKVESATKTVTSASGSIQFTNLKGNPTSFVVTSSANLSTGGAPYKTAAVVFDGTNVIGQYITNTSNAQMSYDDESFSKSYSNGTLTITGTNSNFQANEYVLVYTYGGTSANIGTEQVQVGSGATSITFTGLSDEPTYFSCLFTSDIGTSSGYTRAHVVVFDGSGVYGMEMGSGSSATEHWSYTYNNGSLTISSQSTSSGGYFHQPGYYQLTYAVGGEIELITEPLNVTENGTYTAPKGKAYTPVTVNVSGGGGDVNVETKTATASNYPVSIQFTSMKGQPKWFALRSTSQISSSGNTTYYYIIDMIYDGNSSKTCQGNCFRIGSTRRVDTITSGYSWSYSGTTLTITSSASSRSASPGAFNNGYQLVYIY